MKKDQNNLSTISVLEPSRLMAYSDGIFAIVVTLLVLGIDIPEGHDFSKDGLNAFLVNLEPSFIAYITSFLMISVYWMQHHVIFHFVKYTNAKLIWLNVIMLMLVSLLPFISKLKALYKYDLEVVVIFGIAHILCGLSLYLIWRYVLNHKSLVEPEINTGVRKWGTLRILYTPAVCLLAIVISFFGIKIGTYFFLLIPAFLVYNTFQHRASIIESDN